MEEQEVLKLMMKRKNEDNSNIIVGYTRIGRKSGKAPKLQIKGRKIHFLPAGSIHITPYDKEYNFPLVYMNTKVGRIYRVRQ